MSLLSRARLRGTTVSIYRAPDALTGDGGRAAGTWALVAAEVPCLIERESDEWMQKRFGTPTIVKDRGFFPGGPDVRPGDGIVATAGRRAGDRWRVQGALALDARRRIQHVDVALEQTTEMIP